MKQFEFLGTKKKTDRHGVTETSEILPVVQFWDSYIACDMLEGQPPIMAATIKENWFREQI